LALVSLTPCRGSIVKIHRETSHHYCHHHSTVKIHSNRGPIAAPMPMPPTPYLGIVLPVMGFGPRECPGVLGGGGGGGGGGLVSHCHGHGSFIFASAFWTAGA